MPIVIHLQNNLNLKRYLTWPATACNVQDLCLALGAENDPCVPPYSLTIPFCPISPLCEWKGKKGPSGEEKPHPNLWVQCLLCLTF